MFEQETRKEILKRMLDRVDPALDKREGSVVYDMLAPSSVEFENIYLLMDTLLRLPFADTSSDGFLDLVCSQMGVYRKEAVKARGTVIFNGQAGLSIPLGSGVSTGGDHPIYFYTLTDVVIDSTGQVSVEVECELGGIGGNILAGSIDYATGNLANIVTVDNPSEFSGGVDVESDDSLLLRYYERVLRPSTSGNANHYLVWAKSRSNVGDALIQPLHYGNGTVRVVLVDANKLPAPQGVIDDVKAYIESVRPVGADVYVEPAGSIAIDVSATLTLESGYTLTQVVPEIEKAIETYLQGLSFQDSVVRYSQIANAILDTVGVLDYTNLTVNGATNNITVASDKVAIKGAMTFV